MTVEMFHSNLNESGGDYMADAQVGGAVAKSIAQTKENLRNKMLQQINEQIANQKNDIKTTIDEFISSPEGVAKILPVGKIWALRREILLKFKGVKIDVPAVIYEEIEHGTSNDLNGIKKIIEECQKEVRDAVSVQNNLKEECERYKKMIKAIEDEK